MSDTYEYTPYGELQSHTGESNNSFLFTGEQFDAESNDYYLRARYYNPKSTRFMSRDSYDGRDYEPETLNHYLYVHGNPVNYIDPSGYATIMGLSASTVLQGSLRLAQPSAKIISMMTRQALTGQNGRGLLMDFIVDSAIDAVIGTLGLNLDINKQGFGSKAHKALEDLLKATFNSPMTYGPIDVHLIPEVFFESVGKGKGVGKRAKGSLGVDIAMYLTQTGKDYTDKDLKAVFDLKTGAPWNKSQLKKMQTRYGKDIPIIQIMIPVRVGRR